MIWLSVMLSWQTSWAWENINLTPAETQSTIQTLQACDGALGAQRRYTNSLELINRVQQERLEKPRGLLDEPAFWFVTGMLVTGMTVRLVK